MSVLETIKLFRPQAGDIIVVDFNKVNMTQVEQALKVIGEESVPIIGVHDIQTIKLYGMREQRDHSQNVATLQLQLDAANKENVRLGRIIKDDMVPKAMATPQPQAVGNLAPKLVPVSTGAVHLGIDPITGKPLTDSLT